MDMAGFAVHVREFLSKKYVKMGFMRVKGRQRPVKPGYLETTYLEHFASKKSVECRSPENEARSSLCAFCIVQFNLELILVNFAFLLRSLK